MFPHHFATTYVIKNKIFDYWVDFVGCGGVVLPAMREKPLGWRVRLLAEVAMCIEYKAG